MTNGERIRAMTDKELIKAFRECRKHFLCKWCPEKFGVGGCSIAEFAHEKLVRRLEALVAENAKLICEKSELEQEIGRLEVQNEHFREAAKMVPIRRIYHGVLDTLQHGTFSDEPPSTEGVE